MIKKLSALIGTWVGKGTARFPTIETTGYIEELEFGFTGDDEAMTFEQKTWHIENGEKGMPLHWESGFIIAYADGSFELFNAQNSKRVEVMKCDTAEMNGGKIKLTFISKYFGNDERLIRTERTYFADGNSLRYEMKMATQNTPEFQGHLEANLKLKTT